MKLNLYKNYENDYSSYTDQMQHYNPIRLTGARSPALTKHYTDLLRRDRGIEPPQEQYISRKRPWWDRILSPLMIGNYTVAGFVDGIADGKGGRTPLQGAWEGVKASNPFGSGFEEGATSFTDVFETAGWRPEGKLGKATRWTAGLITDIFADPTTYLTGGASAIVKGTGRTGKTAKSLRTLGRVSDEAATYTAKYSDLISKGASVADARKAASTASKATKVTRVTPKYMTDEMATTIVQRQAMETGRTVKNVGVEATNLANRYNKALGIYDARGMGGITWGPGNMPFAPRSWRKAVINISDGKTARAIGDLSFGRAYSAARDKIYGGKIGELLSSTTKFYRAAHLEPKALLHTMEAISHTRGLKMEKILADKHVHDYVKDLNMTPAENKEMLKALEDNTVWSKIGNLVKTSQSENREVVRQALRKNAQEAQTKINTYLDKSRVSSDYASALRHNIDLDKNVVDGLKSDLDKELLDIDIRYAKEGEELDSLARDLNEAITEIDTSTPDTDKIITQLHDEVLRERQALKEHRKMSDHISRQRIETVTPDVGDVPTEMPSLKTIRNTEEALSKQIEEVKRLKTNTEYDEAVKFLEKSVADGVGESELKLARERTARLAKEMEEAHNAPIIRLAEAEELRLRGELSDMYSNSRKLIKQADGGEYGGLTIKELEELTEHMRHASSPATGREAVKEIDIEDLRKGVNEAVTDALAEHGKAMPSSKASKDLSDVFSTHIYGFKNGLDGMSPQALDDLVKAHNKGSSAGELREMIENAPLRFSGRMSEINSAVAQHLGYKSWNEDGMRYPLARLLGKKPFQVQKQSISELQKQASIKFKLGEFNAKQKREYSNLMQLTAKRNQMRSDLASMPLGEYKHVQREMANANLLKEVGYYETSDGYLDMRRHDFYQDDYEFRSMDNMSPDAPGTFDYIENPTRATGVDTTLRSGLKTQRIDIPEMIEDAEYLMQLPPGRLSKTPERMSRFVAEVDEVIAKRFDRPFVEMTDNQKRFALSLAEENLRDIHGVNYLSEISSAKNAMEAYEIGLEKKLATDMDSKPRAQMTPQEVFAESDLAQSELGRREMLYRKWEETSEQALNLDSRRMAERDRLSKQFNESIKRTEETILKQESTLRSLNEPANAADAAKIDALQEEIRFYNEVLRNDDAFETYIQSKSEYADLFDEEKLTTKLGEKYLKDKMSSDRIAEVTTDLYQKFNKIGMEEVGIGKLTEEQFMANMHSYAPHVLTPEGRNYITQMKEASVRPKMNTRPTEDLGYGLKHSPFSQSRTFDGTIEEANEFFREALKGKNMFSENVADIYIARAMKHNELMFDEKYMQSMMYTFGKEIPEGGAVEAGYKAVMNYGMLRETTRDMASMKVNSQISREMGEFIRDNVTEYKRMAFEGNQSFQELLDAGIDNFFETNYGGKRLTELWDAKHAEVLTDSKLPGAVFDDEALPMVELSAEQVNSIRDTFRRVKLDQEEVLTRSHAGAVDRGDIERLADLEKRFAKVNNMHEPQIMQVNDAIVHEANKARQLQRAKDQSKLLTLYDKFLTLIKAHQTYVLPAHHSRNKLSNMFNNWLVVGRDAANLDWQVTATRLSHHRGDMGAAKAATKNSKRWARQSKPVYVAEPHPSAVQALGLDDNGLLHWDEVYRLADAYGVIDHGQFAQDIGRGTTNKGLAKGKASFETKSGKKINIDPTDTEGFIGFEIGQKVGTTVENSDRLINFMSGLKNGLSVEEAADNTFKALFNYSDVTAFEQHVMKRIFPYYTWLRKNARLQVSSLVESPEKFRLIAKISNGVENMNDAEDRIDRAFVSDWAKSWIQTPFSITQKAIYDENGQEIRPEIKKPILASANLPYMDFERIPDPLRPMDSLRDIFTQTSPLIKNPVEMLLNTNVFFDSPIAKEGESKALEYTKHLLSQFGLVNIATGFQHKDTFAEKALHVSNVLTGVKGTPYNEQLSRHTEGKRMNDERNSIDERLSRGVNSIMDGGIRHLERGFFKTLDGVSNMVGQAPDKPEDYTGALRPISEDSYNKLSLKEQAKYTAPTKRDATAYSREAEALSDEAYKNSGIAKRFVWAMVDGLDWRDDTSMTVGRVDRIIDGDTFVANIAGKEETVRLLLMDTPESQGQYRDAPQAYSEVSTQYAEEFVLGEEAQFHISPNKDFYGRTLAYVEVDGVDVGKQMIEDGSARVRYTEMGTSNARKDEYFDAQMESARQGKGVWSEPYYGGDPSKDEGFNEFDFASETMSFSDRVNMYLKRYGGQQ